MGGSSSINGMWYARGSRHDYDDWAKYGNPGWSYDDVLPYFKKSEDSRMHGVSNSNHRFSIILYSVVTLLIS